MLNHLSENQICVFKTLSFCCVLCVLI